MQALPLATVTPAHPCLWGEIGVTAPRPLVSQRQAQLLPTRRTGCGEAWWDRRSQGGLDQDGQPIEALTDVRGHRAIYPLEAQELAGGSGKAQAIALYGGTIYEHFGHLLLDLTRLYQLLPLFRRSKLPIWVHYPGLEKGATIEHPLVREWLECLGITERVRVIRRRMQCDHLISAEVLYRDRQFVRSDFLASCQQALQPRLRRRLLKIQPEGKPIAYLSRHGLSSGTTRFEGEEEVVAALRNHPKVEIIQPERLSIVDKLALFRRYRLITGFAQACMNLKYFTPSRRQGDLAQQLMFVAGPESLSSNWVNLDRASGLGDQVLDCSCVDLSTSAAGSASGLAGSWPDAAGQAAGNAVSGGVFQRHNRFRSELVIDCLRNLASR